MTDKSFVHLHNHSEFSFIDGSSLLPSMASICNELNMPAIALTDHGNMYGAVDFYNSCKFFMFDIINHKLFKMKKILFLSIIFFIVGCNSKEKKPNSKRTQHRLKLIGQKILNSTLKEIKL